jgi:hypothetical protein
MPGTELEELDLGEAFSNGFLNPGAAVTFQLEVTTSSEIAHVRRPADLAPGAGPGTATRVPPRRKPNRTRTTVPARVRPDHLTTEAAAASGCPHSR